MREERASAVAAPTAREGERPQRRRSSLPAKAGSVRSEKAELTAPEAAKLLGVSSANTVKNWLEGGMFPSAFRTLGGHWRFPREEVLAVKTRMQELRAKNERGDLSPDVECDDAGMPPLL